MSSTEVKILNIEKIILTKSITADKFALAVSDIVDQYDIGYIEAVIHFCDKNKLELESIIPFIKGNDRLKFNLQVDAEKLSFLPKTSRLPI